MAEKFLQKGYEIVLLYTRLKGGKCPVSGMNIQEDHCYEILQGIDQRRITGSYREA